MNFFDEFAKNPNLIFFLESKSDFFSLWGVTFVTLTFNLPKKVSNGTSPIQ